MIVIAMIAKPLSITVGVPPLHYASSRPFRLNNEEAPSWVQLGASNFSEPRRPRGGRWIAMLMVSSVLYSLGSGRRCG